MPSTFVGSLIASVGFETCSPAFNTASTFSAALWFIVRVTGMKLDLTRAFWALPLGPGLSGVSACELPVALPCCSKNALNDDTYPLLLQFDRHLQVSLSRDRVIPSPVAQGRGQRRSSCGTWHGGMASSCRSERKSLARFRGALPTSSLHTSKLASRN
jgi:hypothetical protein